MQTDLPPVAPAPKVEPEKQAPKGSKDLTVRSEEDRVQMLDSLFLKLRYEVDEEEAKLVAEEVWAVFLQSGSASVDFLLHRGIARKTGATTNWPGVCMTMYCGYSQITPKGGHVRAVWRRKNKT